MSPNQEHTPVMSVGVGRSRVASKYFLHGWTLMEVILKLANSAVSASNTNLLGLRIMPLWPQMLSHSTTWRALGEIVGPEKCVSNAFGLVRDMRDNLIKSSKVAITKCHVQLGCCFVSVSHPWGNERGEVAVIGVKGKVAIPTDKDSLLSATRYAMCLMKWALCVRRFLRDMEVECLEIHCPPGFAIFLSAYHQAVAPGHGFTHWHWLKDAQ